MEKIIQIKEISLSGLDSIFIPFGIQIEDLCTFVEFESLRSAGELTSKLANIFYTDNFFEKREFSKDFGKYSNTKGMYRIRFVTCKNEYVLWRYFIGYACTECVLQKVGTDIFYSGRQAIEKLKKISKPMLIDNGHFYSDKSTIFKPHSDVQRKEMIRMVNLWFNSLNFEGFVDLKFDGTWIYNNVNRYNMNSRGGEEIPSFIRLFTNLAQSIMRIRILGQSPVVFTTLESRLLNKFEFASVLELARSISESYNLNYVILFERFNGSELVNPVQTPSLEIY